MHKNHFNICEKEVEIYSYGLCNNRLKDLLNDRKPFVLKDYNIGSCKEKWNRDYLTKMLGSTEVKVHVSQFGMMNFIDKNFVYKTLNFDEFIIRASEKEHQNFFFSKNEVYYLRSIGDDKRGKNKANLEVNFPQIKNDVKWPNLFEETDFFSSILRIGSENVQIWTHYDILDNMLMQVVGEKKIVLFEPDDVQFMYLKGDKSAVIDIDNPDEILYPNFYKATRYKTILTPGDILFIPALWFHNTKSLTFSIGVNVFWKNLKHSFYDETDAYGNKDLLPASKALSMIEKAIKELETLPLVYRKFYANRAITSIEKLTKHTEDINYSNDDQKVKK